MCSPALPRAASAWLPSGLLPRALLHLPSALGAPGSPPCPPGLSSALRGRQEGMGHPAEAQPPAAQATPQVLQLSRCTGGHPVAAGEGTWRSAAPRLPPERRAHPHTPTALSGRCQRPPRPAPSVPRSPGLTGGTVATTCKRGPAMSRLTSTLGVEGWVPELVRSLALRLPAPADPEGGSANTRAVVVPAHPSGSLVLRPQPQGQDDLLSSCLGGGDTHLPRPATPGRQPHPCELYAHSLVSLCLEFCFIFF